MWPTARSYPCFTTAITVAIFDKVHDYEVFSINSTIFMMWSSNKDFAIRITALHEGDDQLTGDDTHELSTDLDIVHSFKCHVNQKLASEVTCAFAADGYMIMLVTYEKSGRSLKEKRRRQLKMFKNLSGLKMDFDEHLLAVSGELFTFTEQEISFDRKSFPGIAIYNLSDSSELIAGHISSKELGFNPSSHNHDLRIVQRHNVSMIGVRGYDGQIEVYELREPHLIFNNIEKSDLDSQKLVLNSYQTDRYQLSSFFALDPNEVRRPEQAHTDKPKSTEDHTSHHISGESHNRSHDGAKKVDQNGNSFFWVVLILIFGGIGGFYFFTQRQNVQAIQRREYEMTNAQEDAFSQRDTHRIQESQDNSVFDKTA